LALRVFIWFRNPMIRGLEGSIVPNLPLSRNGDFSPAGTALFFGSTGAGAGNAPGSIEDVYRLYWQSMEQIHWSYGTGDKFSIQNMATKYFPDGGGLHGDMGAASDLIHWNNGMPTHTSVLRLARAVLLPPRQNIKCSADMNPLPDGGNNGAVGGVVAITGRNMLSISNNLNAVDGIGKVVQFCFDGLWARDVQ
jgi:hypothetical protein